MSFTPDDQIQKIAEAYALDACDFLRDHFHITLDWSDASIQHIEKALDTFHIQAKRDKPSDKQVMGFAKMFGSYIGEVFRRNHGATWGMVDLNGERFPGLEALSTATTFWPWGRAFNRIRDGAENNVWHYYNNLLQRTSATT